MIHEVDEGLRALVEREALRGAAVEVVFDTPTRDWSARRSGPALDLFLYDIREDLGRREVGLTPVHEADGRVRSRRPSPRRFRLSYMVTAWTQRPEDEHRLLAAVLQCLIAHQALPTDVLVGPLAELGLAVDLDVARPPTEDRSIADVWTALGGEMKPSLDLVVNVPFVVERELTAGPPVLEEPRIAVSDSTRGSRELAGRPGRLGAADLAPTAPVAGAGADAVTETRRGGDEVRPGRVVRVRDLRRR